MDSKSRSSFWNLPLYEYKKRLEDVIMETKELKIRKSNVSILDGIARILVTDSQKKRYNIEVRREIPRYCVSLGYDSESSFSELIEECVFRAVQGEACVDVKINGEHYGAIPLDYHKL